MCGVSVEDLGLRVCAFDAQGAGEYVQVWGVYGLAGDWPGCRELMRPCLQLLHASTAVLCIVTLSLLLVRPLSTQKLSWFPMSVHQTLRSLPKGECSGIWRSVEPLRGNTLKTQRSRCCVVALVRLAITTHLELCVRQHVAQTSNLISCWLVAAASSTRPHTHTEAEADSDGKMHQSQAAHASHRQWEAEVDVDGSV